MRVNSRTLSGARSMAVPTAWGGIFARSPSVTSAPAARSIFRKLGFHEETVLPDYVKDLEGHKQDMILMRCDLQALWSELEDFISTWDWQRTR